MGGYGGVTTKTGVRDVHLDVNLRLGQEERFSVEFQFQFYPLVYFLISYGNLNFFVVVSFLFLCSSEGWNAKNSTLPRKFED